MCGQACDGPEAAHFGATGTGPHPWNARCWSRFEGGAPVDTGFMFLVSLVVAVVLLQAVFSIRRGWHRR